MTKPTDIAELQNRAEEVAELLKTLSHSTRLLIACALTEGEMSVSELELFTGADQPHLSRDLSRMRREHLVKARRQSKNVFYRLTDERLERLVAALCSAFGEPAKPKRRPSK